MKKTSATIVFFGNERLATGVSTTAPTLRALIDSGYHVAAVISNYEPGVSRKVRKLEIAEVATKYNIPVLLPKKLRDIKDQLNNYQADVGILVAYGHIVPQQIIDFFPSGIINIHPSLLPLHRGPTPIESAMLEGASKTGVSLMKLVKAMDAGPVYAQIELPLVGKEDKQDLMQHLLTLGGQLLIKHLPAILDKSLAPTPQDDTHATYDSLITKTDGIIDWHKPAIRVEREIRAYLEWPKSRTILAGKDVVITEATVINKQGEPGTATNQNKELTIFCGQDALIVKKLKPAGKNEMTGEAFLAGHKALAQGS